MIPSLIVVCITSNKTLMSKFLAGFCLCVSDLCAKLFNMEMRSTNLLIFIQIKIINFYLKDFAQGETQGNSEMTYFVC